MTERPHAARLRLKYRPARLVQTGEVNITRPVWVFDMDRLGLINSVALAWGCFEDSRICSVIRRFVALLGDV